MFSRIRIVYWRFRIHEKKKVNKFLFIHNIFSNFPVVLAVALFETHLLAAARRTNSGFSVAGVTALASNTSVAQVIGDGALAALDAVNVTALGLLASAAGAALAASAPRAALALALALAAPAPRAALALAALAPRPGPLDTAGNATATATGPRSFGAWLALTSPVFFNTTSTRS